jgi:hypothetical protein
MAVTAFFLFWFDSFEGGLLRGTITNIFNGNVIDELIMNLKQQFDTLTLTLPLRQRILN